jgi:glycosyltransferase involved in cell wall biosynthesis
MLGSDSGMKVLYHHRTQGGWVESVHIHGIVDGLRAMGHDVGLVGPPTAVATPASQPSAASQALRLAAKRLPQSGFELLEIAYNLAAYPRLLKAARAMKPDVLYERAAAHLFVGALVSRQLGIPLVVEFNDVAGQAGVRRQRLTGVARRVEAYVLRRTDAAITVTSYLRDQLLSRGLSERQVTVISNAVDPTRFRPNLDGRPVRQRYGVGDDDCLVGFTGAMSPWYRLVDVVQEFTEIFAQAPWMRLLLIGDGPEREAVRQKIADLNCGDKVILGPRIPHDEVPAHVAAFDIAFIPHCDRHNSPVKLFEYLGTGKPVVAVRTPGITDVVTHEREALLAEAGDLRTVMRYVARLAENRDEAAAMSRRGLALALERHTWPRNAERTYAVLESVVSGQWSVVSDDQPLAASH